jgi:uncharacterized DUF497 family protein
MLLFEWDAAKARENEAKHGVSFELATEVFEDPYFVLAADVVHSVSEPRFFAFGRVAADGEAHGQDQANHLH